MKNIILKITMVAMLLLIVGCSGESGNQQPSSEQLQIDQLTLENEILRTELEALRASLESAELRIENLRTSINNATKKFETELSTLKEELSAAQENSTVQTETEATSFSIVPPQSDPNELLIGEWYYQTFHEDGSFSWAQSMVFSSNGTGTIRRTYYVPLSDVESIKEMVGMGAGFEDFDSSSGFSWSLDGNLLHISLQTGETADFTFSSESQQLTQATQGSNPQVYARQLPSGMDQYTERSRFVNDTSAKKAILMRKFLGTWYYDVLEWTFNEDGTGIIDIPALGNQPATQQKFTYMVSDDPGDVTYLCLIIDWDETRTSYYYPVFNSDGSIVLRDAGDSELAKLTRVFDLNNCPISTAIIQNGIGVMTGSIFDDILP